MVNNGTEPLITLYACNIEVAGTSYDRVEVADVPFVAPVDRNDLMLSKVNWDTNRNHL